MQKRLTGVQFDAAIKGLDVGEQTLEIARGVLVDGVPQAVYAKRLGLSKGAVSQAVSRVWNAHMETNIPPGYERVVAILPKQKAFIVKQWVENLKKKSEGG
jgi:hypothetical protein